jgi:hypothetical protein
MTISGRRLSRRAALIGAGVGGVVRWRPPA